MPPRKKSFEATMARLEEIVASLEQGDQTLESGMALYREGVAAARGLREQLEKARHELTVWQDSGTGDGEGKAVPFGQDDDGMPTAGQTLLASGRAGGLA